MKNLADIPFPFYAECEAFNSSYSEAVAKRANEMRATWMPTENTQSYRHGIHWQAHNASDPNEVSTMSSHSHEFTVRHLDVVEANETIIFRLLRETAKKINDSFQISLYQTIEESCERTGQVVKGAGRPPSESFIEALNSVEFGVDKNGQPSLPQFHVGAEAFNAMMQDLAKQGPEFRAKVEEIKERKIAAALLVEQERLSKFRKRS